MGRLPWEMRASFTKPLCSCVLVHPWQLVSSSSLFSLGRSASHPTHMQPPMAVCIQQTARRAPNLADCIPQASPTALVQQSATTGTSVVRQCAIPGEPTTQQSTFHPHLSRQAVCMYLGGRNCTVPSRPWPSARPSEPYRSSPGSG